MESVRAYRASGGADAHAHPDANASRAR
jgi:hypothetical protein